MPLVEIIGCLRLPVAHGPEREEVRRAVKGRMAQLTLPPVAVLIGLWVLIASDLMPCGRTGERLIAFLSGCR